MSQLRSKEYTKLVLDIFLMNVSEIEAELRRLTWFSTDSNQIFVGDVTYAEYEFLLLTERDFKVNCLYQSSELPDEIGEFLSSQ